MDRKIILRPGTELKFENYESVQHRLQFSGTKKGATIHFIGTLTKLTITTAIISQLDEAFPITIKLQVCQLRVTVVLQLID